MFSGNIYLMGFMGAGKSTVGKALAERLGRAYVDVDEVFADRHGGVTTGRYIETHGMDAFRVEERETLADIARDVHDAVVATGGGVPTYPGNLEIMKASGATVHVKVPLEVIAARMTPGELARRPVWTRLSPDRLRDLYDSRLVFYDAADIIVLGDAAVSAVVDEIIGILKRKMV